jgi:hypothetical protein
MTLNELRHIYPPMKERAEYSSLLHTNIAKVLRFIRRDFTYSHLLRVRNLLLNPAEGGHWKVCPKTSLS